MNDPKPKNLTRVLLLMLVFGVISVVWYLCGPGDSGVLGEIKLADGSEYRITQKFNWSAEPYTVSFYMRKGDGPWGWCYIDHEAWRWRDVVMTYDAASDSVIVTERGTKRAVLDRRRSMFWMDNGGLSREVAAPQEVLKPGMER
jgi:hypothetical protein